jgi:hypothetical protein
VLLRFEAQRVQEYTRLGGAMLYEFVETYREAIIAKTRIKVSTRPWPPAEHRQLVAQDDDFKLLVLSRSEQEEDQLQNAVKRFSASTTGFSRTISVRSGGSRLMRHVAAGEHP